MTTRKFEFSEGTSNKFWTIALDGASHTVKFGRIGTAGQTSTAQFGSDAEARKSYDKLVAEKLKKGYVEKSDGATSAAPAPVQKAASAAPAAPAKAPASAASAPNPPAKVPAPAAPAVDSRPALDLDVMAYSYVAGGRTATTPLAPAEPFDLEDCLQRLRTKVRVKSYGWLWDFSQALPDRALSRPEAEFWLTAMARAHTRNIAPGDVADELRQHSFSGVDPYRAIQISSSMSPYAVQCLATLMSPHYLRTLLLTPQVPRSYSTAEKEQNLRNGFRAFVLPYLDDEEIAKWQAATRELWPQCTWPSDYYTPPAPAYFYGAMFGLHDEVRALAAQLPDDLYADTSWDHTHYHRPQEILYGAGSAEDVVYHFRRLKLATNMFMDIQTLVAVAGLGTLDIATRTIANTGKKEDAEELFRAFEHIHAPEAAPHVLELQLNSKAPKAARIWLENNLDAAIIGLLPVAAAGPGKLADAATEFLLSTKRRGQGDRIVAQLGTVDPEVAARVRAKVLDVVEEQLTAMTGADTPTWWTQALAQTPVKKSKAVAWVVPADLPAITVGDHALGPDHVAELLNVLQASSLEAPHPLLASLREHASGERLDAFGWKLFEGWLGEGAPSKDKWAFVAAGFLGGDRTVLKLAPMVREWPGESQHQRAVLGLDVLRTIGTDTALMQINGIAQKVKFKGLKERAVQCMDAIAASRNMTRAQLEDRIVPDCGLDERGMRTFDFGPRQFRFVLGPELKPMIRYPDGATKTDLPKPGAKDDAAKAGPAVGEWKLLKKQIADVAKIQAVRLEQAMVTGRRWSGKEFDQLILHHPLMVHLARLIVWASYDGGGKVKATFRVTEDQTLADASDAPFDLAATATVGILHPMQVTGQPHILEQWGQLFGDYEMVPPFPQLGRPAYHLTKEQLAQKEITHFETRARLAAQTLVFGLEKLGWARGVPADAGWVGEHSKQFPGANVTAVICYEEGFSVGYWEGAGEQTIKRVFFIAGLYTPQMYPDHKDALKLADVDPIALSEVLGDCELLLSKAK